MRATVTEERRERRRPGRGGAAWALAALVLALGSGPAPAAQETGGGSSCDLRQARQLYEIGRFEAALAILEPCVKTGFEAREREEGYALLAKTYLVLDRFEEAREAVHSLVALNPNYSPDTEDPLWFVEQVRTMSAGEAVQVVTSVSKTPESLRLAPATVVVVTSQEIARRGYLDLEAVLHDLPGFDISRGNGDIYSLFYQRGYRSRNDRTLFLVDGVEQNDLWQNTAYLSRQYPLSNVDRIEVIYGPASTMYGANAFVGVINVVTKEPEALLADGERFGGSVQVGGGTWATRFTDTTVAWRHPTQDISFSFAGRLYRSDEMDLSGFPEWDYDPAFYDGVDYGRVLSVRGREQAGAFLGALSEADAALLASSPYVDVVGDGGTVTDLLLTPAGAARARQLDRGAYGRLVGGRPVAYSDRTDDWLLYGKLKLHNLSLGIQTWRREEGFTSWYTDNLYPGADNGVLWIPEQTFVYLKYSRDLTPDLGLTVFSRFKRHTLAPGTQEQQLRNYATGDLDLLNLAQEVPSFWRTTGFDLLSRQFRTEVTVVYAPSPRLDVVAGFDGRSSVIQGDFLRTVEGSEIPGENVEQTKGELIDQLDLGIFAQASYRFSERLKLVLGSRLDSNEVRGGGGYGTVFNPRLAAIWSPGSFVVKGIYAEAFKDASNFNRYAIAPGFRDLPNPDLKPEKVKNYELAFGWSGPSELSLEVAAYRADYSDAVVAARVPFGDGTTLQNQSGGSMEITGLQASLTWHRGGFDLFANYTYTDPRSTNPLTAEGEPRTDEEGNPLSDVRVGDIAEHRLNLGLSTRLFERLDLDLRLNYVGDRPTGADTSVPLNPLDRIEGYTVINAAVSYEGLLPGLRLQLLVNNLLDEAYFHPGVSVADGLALASRIPQNERSVFLRVAYDF